MKNKSHTEIMLASSKKEAIQRANIQHGNTWQFIGVYKHTPGKGNNFYEFKITPHPKVNPLFTTKDKVRIFEGDEYYALDPKTGKYVWSIADSGSLESNWKKYSKGYYLSNEQGFSAPKEEIKILIQVDDGKVSATYSNSANVQIVVADMGNVSKGSHSLSDILPPEAIRENLYELFTDKSDPIHMEIRDELKRRHF